MSDLYNYKNKKDEQTMIKTDTGKRKKEQYIENLKEGDIVNDLFAVKIKNPPRPYKRGTWFNLIVNDKTGEINVKFWGGENKERVKRLYDSFKTGDVIQVRQGNVEIYADNPQVSVSEKAGGIRRCSPDEYNIDEFLPSLEKDNIKELMIKIKNHIKTVKNKNLKTLLDSFFNDDDFVEKFSTSPSAITHHHNYVGGNLEHTLGVVRLCNNLCEMYKGIDRDLVITGAILHDIGKLKEYDASATIDKTDEGNFIGHIVMGDRWIREKIDEIRKKDNSFDKDLENKICHIILSHHGKYEFGSPLMPKTIEAMLVHSADLMDSQVKNFIQNIQTGRENSDDDWGFLWDSDLGQRRTMYIGEK
jgi:3'-5' exoribonuclease